MAFGNKEEMEQRRTDMELSEVLRGDVGKMKTGGRNFATPETLRMKKLEVEEKHRSSIE